MLGVLVSGSGIGETDPVVVNQLVLGSSVTGTYDPTSRSLSVTGLGEAGPAGASYAATSASYVTIGTGSKTFVTQAGLAYLAGARVRIVSRANAANYMEGVVSSYAATSMVVAVGTVGGSGTPGDWNISLAGISGESGATGATWFPEVETATGMRVGDFAVHTFGPGATWVYRYDGTSPGYVSGWAQVANIGGAAGAIGPGYAATSASSLAIGDGAKTFVTQAGLAYVAGQRVRASYVEDAPARYMEGLVTSYSGTSLVVLVDRIFGEGTLDDWLIGIAGDAGATGPSGANHATMGPWGATVFDSGATGSNWQYLSPSPTAAPIVSTTATDATAQLPARVYVSRDGVLTGMRVTIETAHSAALTFVVYINGTPTSCTVTLTAGNTSGIIYGLSLALNTGSVLLIRNTCTAERPSMLAKATLNVTWT